MIYLFPLKIHFEEVKLEVHLSILFDYSDDENGDDDDICQQNVRKREFIQENYPLIC